MSNFNTAYKTPLDRAYFNEFISSEPTPKQSIEKPIVPIKDLGITVVERDPKSGAIEYKFQTKSDGTSTCKSPIGCFADILIPNDMGFVVDTITEYYK